ncbi:chromosome segregation protein SMC [Geobacter argillaceus]|uniref:Chromosome partition protein Smc n=1 Tax=Geobacter argillaceus TaxID=345631 RepID=A0A562V6L9_9BACT|nr:chromosome segregation protein SMC [Geobacter argillaceus]TWJ13513.1 condensin subunit Smc [Geobacter argillaceus]
MKIKRLEIIGFKSFVDRTILDFPQGVTAVVGPNGCGKSNVVDAIRWVMGEQSVKNLRGRQMEDVIFGGSEGRKPLGMAEVSLVFSAEDGRVPAKYLNFSEIQVTRRLFRDGESEYLLNKTPCRLMDIAELFMDTGVGARAYSIIEQGRIGMILLAKPEERRFLIEEAAGVTKFKSRKLMALKKIETTRQNLLRIGDLVGELKRQLGSLQRQARKAERFRAFREELKEIELLMVARRFAALSADRQRLTSDLAALAERETTAAADLAGRELALEQLRMSLCDEEQLLAQGQEQLYQVRSEFQTAENRRELLGRELTTCREQMVRLNEDLASLERQLVEAGAEQRLLNERRESFGLEAAGEVDALAEQESTLRELTEEEKQTAAQLEDERRTLFTLLAEISQYGNQESSALRRLEGLAERAERSRREGMTLAERLVEANGRSGELATTVAAGKNAREELQGQLSRLRGREEELREKLALLDRELQQQRDELSRTASRLHSLEELEAQFAGYGQGVRNVFQASGFRERFRGVVADLVETAEKYETALEAVLGERLQAVLAAETVDVLAAVSHLKETAGGRCSFLLPSVSVPPAGDGLSGADRLLDLVRILPEYQERIAPFLRDVYLAEDLNAGLELTRRHPHLTFVTPQGDLACAGGMVAGGSREAAQQGLVTKKREIRALTGDVARLEANVATLGADRQTTGTALAAVEEELRQVRQELHQADMALLNAEKDLQRAGEECQRLEERLAVKALEDDQLNEERELLEAEAANVGQRREEAEAGKGDREAAVAVLQESLAVQRRRIEQAREEVTALKVRTAALNEKRESTQRALKRVEELRGDLAQRLDRRREELTRSEAESLRLTGLLSEQEAAVKGLVIRQAEAEEAVSALRERFNVLSQGSQTDETALKGIRSSLDELRRQVGVLTLQQSELNLQLEHLETVVRDKYRLSMDEVLPRSSGMQLDEEERQARQAELQRLLDELGEVNLTAIEEYRDLEERHAFVTAQMADLEESLHALQQAIQRINRTTRKRFQETFHLVNAKFQEIFPRLFCGGKAELRLTDEEDLLETGIDIIVQPPGKKLQNVTLLSGGEKALTAVALIFAIFLIKPSPFCLLDEVDAPLDDANIGRFNDMIREMCAVSQFILITHSKTTMAVADTLYGVTMEEPGVSKVVSVRLQ